MSKEFWSILIPGPIVLETEILVIYLPLTVVGLALAIVLTTNSKFYSNLAPSNETLPITVWTFP